MTRWGACLWRRSGRLHDAEESQNARAGRSSQTVKPHGLVLHRGTLRLRAGSSERGDAGSYLLAVHRFAHNNPFDYCYPYFMEGSVVRGGAAIRIQARLTPESTSDFCTKLPLAEGCFVLSFHASHTPGSGFTGSL